MSTQQIARRGLMGATSVGVDMISGTATAVGTTLTMPVPDGYYFYIYLKTVRTLASGDLWECFFSPFGLYRQKETLGGMERITQDPATPVWYISRTATSTTLSCSNRNTSGLITDGDEYGYVAWKEAD